MIADQCQYDLIQTILCVQFVKIKLISDEEDSVIRVGPIINCWSPYKSEIGEPTIGCNFNHLINNQSNSSKPNLPIRNS